MAFPFTFSLLSIGFFGAITPRIPPAARLWSVLPLSAAILLMYIASHDRVAQDRRAYFDWYQSARQILSEPTAQDRAFTHFLTLMPANLSEVGFGLLLISTLAFCLLLFLGLAARAEILPLGLVPLVLAIAVSDRMFLDLALNTSRSSIAALLFIGGLVCKNRPTRALFWLAAFGIHSKVMLMLLGCYVAMLALRRVPIMFKLLIATSIVAFTWRYTTGGPILFGLDEFELPFLTLNSQSVARVFTLSTTLSHSLAAQLALGLILPLGLALATRTPNEPNTARADLAGMTLITLTVGLLLFPDIQLAQRLFIVPLICLPMFIPPLALIPLAAFKIAILAAVMAGQFTW